MNTLANLKQGLSGSTFEIKDSFARTQIKNLSGMLTTVYKYQGSVQAFSDLPASSQVSIGYVYNIKKADKQNGIKKGDNVAWTGTQWDVLAGTTDLSNYATLDTLTGYVKSSQINNLIDEETDPVFTANSGKFALTDQLSSFLPSSQFTAHIQDYDLHFTEEEKSKLSGIQENAQKNVKSDWNSILSASDSFILNKPTKLSDFINDLPTIYAASGIMSGETGYITANAVYEQLSGIQELLDEVISGNINISGYANLINGISVNGVPVPVDPNTLIADINISSQQSSMTDIIDNGDSSELTVIPGNVYAASPSGNITITASGVSGKVGDAFVLLTLSASNTVTAIGLVDEVQQGKTNLLHIKFIGPIVKTYVEDYWNIGE